MYRSASDSPTGPAMTGFEGPTGSASTGDWALDGMSFYLQDASDGNSLGSAKTLAMSRFAPVHNRRQKRLYQRFAQPYRIIARSDRPPRPH